MTYKSPSPIHETGASPMRAITPIDRSAAYDDLNQEEIAARVAYLRREAGELKPARRPGQRPWGEIPFDGSGGCLVDAFIAKTDIRVDLDMRRDDRFVTCTIVRPYDAATEKALKAGPQGAYDLIDEWIACVSQPRVHIFAKPWRNLEESRDPRESLIADEMTEAMRLVAALLHVGNPQRHDRALARIVFPCMGRSGRITGKDGSSLFSTAMERWILPRLPMLGKLDDEGGRKYAIKPVEVTANHEEMKPCDDMEALRTISRHEVPDFPRMLLKSGLSTQADKQ
jgi:hypothetical protein